MIHVVVSYEFIGVMIFGILDYQISGKECILRGLYNKLFLNRTNIDSEKAILK